MTRLAPVLAAAVTAWLAVLVTGCDGISERAMPGFRDVAAELGLDRDAHVYGPVLVDFDRDGLLDVLFTNHLDPIALHRQQADGRFVDVSRARGLVADTDDKHGAAWADCDGDGRFDLYVAVGTSERMPNRLFHQREDGRFDDVAEAGGVADAWARGRAVSWFDWDGDSLPDLLVTNALREGHRDRVFHNQGGCRFRDVSAESGDLAGGWLSQGGAWADYDGDGDMDLFASGSWVPTPDGSRWQGSLLRNEGGGRFRDVTAEAGLRSERAVGMAWGDYDDDGDLDLFVARGGSPSAKTGPRGRPNRLYRNRGDGTFELAEKALGAAVTRNSQDAVWADLDNDGDLDLYVVNARSAEGPEPNLLYRNEPDGLHDVAAEVGAEGLDWGLPGAVAVGDLDGDGFLDLVVTHGLASMGYDAPPEILRNGGNAGRWLRVALVDAGGSPVVFGARVEIETPDGRRQIRELAGVRRYSQDEPVAHFGLGGHEEVALVRVRWPSGRIQERRGVRAGRLLVVQEDPRLTPEQPSGSLNARSASAPGRSAP